MKSWLTKFRISSALDADSSSSPSKRRTVANSDETRRFEETIQTLDRTLRNQPPRSEAAPDLHATIMNAVRASRASTPARRSPLFVRWLPAPAFAVLALSGLWWALHRPPDVAVHTPRHDHTGLLAIGAAMEAGDNATRTLPPAVVAPLSDELGRVNLDLENTAKFLLTSLP
jgi:hypothetical protein